MFWSLSTDPGYMLSSTLSQVGLFVASLQKLPQVSSLDILPTCLCALSLVELNAVSLENKATLRAFL